MALALEWDHQRQWVVEMASSFPSALDVEQSYIRKHNRHTIQTRSHNGRHLSQLMSQLRQKKKNGWIWTPIEYWPLNGKPRERKRIVYEKCVLLIIIINVH